MLRLVPSFPLLVLAGAVLAAGSGVRAQLPTRSPFIAEAGPGAAAPAAEQPLEFRGYIETGEGVQYRLYDPARKVGAWVRLNVRSPEFDVVVKQHDGAQDTLTVEHQGRTLTLPARKAKVVSSGNASQAMPPAAVVAPSNVPAAVTQAVVLNPTPADEQRRLDAVAAEVARRRALREQASQQAGQVAPAGGAPAMVMPLPAPIPGVVSPAAPPGYVSPTTQFGTRGRGPGPASPR